MIDLHRESHVTPSQTPEAIRRRMDNMTECQNLIRGIISARWDVLDGVDTDNLSRIAAHCAVERDTLERELCRLNTTT